jgi:hypothetical protein
MLIYVHFINASPFGKFAMSLSGTTNIGKTPRPLSVKNPKFMGWSTSPTTQYTVLFRPALINDPSTGGNRLPSTHEVSSE